MSVKNLQIGSPVWAIFSNNRGQSRRDMWEDLVIVGETSRSWIAILPTSMKDYQRNPESYKDSSIKIPKNFEGAMYTAPSKVGNGIRYPLVALTLQAVEDDVWMYRHAHSVRESVRAVNDVDTLRKIAELLGYDAP
jgi:hypothetical protein